MTPDQIIERAYRYLDPKHNVRYRMGAGGMNPGETFPWGLDGDVRILDCSGFACWAIGLKRQQPWGWLYTDSMEADIRNAQKYFERVANPVPGCLIVDGDGPRTGHCGIVVYGTSLDTMRVIDCSSRSDKHAITENAGKWFLRKGNKTVFGVLRQAEGVS